MALTATEKKILGFMTDSGQLVGDMRVQVSSDDAYAREVIAQYKERAIIEVTHRIENYTACLAIEQDKLDTLEEV